MKTFTSKIKIVYTSYRRTELLCGSIASALKEFPFSNIYVYCDRWKNSQDREAILRHYQALKDEFGANKQVFLYMRKRNYGMFNAFDAIRSHLVDCPVLFLEDDLILKKGAGDFIRKYSKMYWNDPSISALSLFNALSSRYVFSCPIKITRTWMWGTMLWPHKPKFLERITLDEIKLLRSDAGIFAKVASYLGDEGLNLAIYDFYNKSFSALDCRLAFRHALYGFRSVAPPVNLVENFGFTGDGAHCPDSKAYAALFEDRQSLDMDMWLGLEAKELTVRQESLAGSLFLAPSDFSDDDLRRDWHSFVWPSLDSKSAYLLAYPFRLISYLLRPRLLVSKTIKKVASML